MYFVGHRVREVAAQNVSRSFIVGIVSLVCSLPLHERHNVYRERIVVVRCFLLFWHPRSVGGTKLFGCDIPFYDIGINLL